MGSRRFIERIWRIAEKVEQKKSSKIIAADTSVDVSDSKFASLLHETIEKVGKDIEGFGFNTAISSLMILSKEFENRTAVSKKDFTILLQLIAPFAPHIADELWSEFASKESKKAAKSVHLSLWPKFDPQKVVKNTATVVIQVNGKVRAEIQTGIDASEDDVKRVALENEIVKKWLNGAAIQRVIYVKNRLLNIVVKQ